MMMNTLNIVILAAGRGNRMNSTLPKVLHPIAGRPMLRHVLDTARQLQAEQRVVVYGHGGHAVRQAIPDLDLTWVQQNEQLGTGHALKIALSVLPHYGQTLVLYGDVPLARADTLQRLCQAAGEGIAVLTDTLDNASGYGRIVRDTAGRVLGIVEDKDCTLAQRAVSEVNTGMMVLPNRRLHDWLHQLNTQNVLQEYYLTDTLAQAVREGLPVSGVPVTHRWEALGVNNKQQLAELERVFQRQQADELLAAGVTLADPARIDVRGHVRVGQDVSIDINCIFEGEVILGDKVSIGAHCVLKNVQVGSGVCIAPFSHLEDAVIGADSHIGPYARLRPGAALAEGVYIGNFVEVKKSQVGAGSKINHLTYIGDAQVGRWVNIGAGSVTCNYNGADKLTTIIEDDVFVGSGTMMVAPVTLEAGSTIGAGSVITKTAPAGQLTLERSQQVTMPGWKRPVKS